MSGTNAKQKRRSGRPPGDSAAETVSKLLDTAQRLVQERGFNAFSYRDLADAVGVRTASIHYHFPSKADLGLALVERYSAQLQAELDALDQRRRSNLTKLEGFVDLYRRTESEGLICLCGSMAADAATLREDLQRAIAEYLRLAESWVRRTLNNGVETGEFETRGSTADLATALVAGLQGALVLRRARAGRSEVDRCRRTLLGSLAPN